MGKIGRKIIVKPKKPPVEEQVAQLEHKLNELKLENDRLREKLTMVEEKVNKNIPPVQK